MTTESPQSSLVHQHDDSSMSEQVPKEIKVPKEDFTTILNRRHEKWKPIVKEFLEQLQENRFFEFSWPPDPDSPMCRYGIVTPFLRKVEVSEESETANKFVDQVRKSWGYDVDCEPPDWLLYQFHRINFRSHTDKVCFVEATMTAVRCVIDRINSLAKKKMGKTFVLVRVDKAVLINRALHLLTLTIKDVKGNARKFIRAAVSFPLGHRPELEECKLISSIPT